MFARRKLTPARIRRWSWRISAWAHLWGITAYVGCRILGVEVPVIDSLAGQKPQVLETALWTPASEPADMVFDVGQALDRDVRALIHPSPDAPPPSSSLAELTPAGEPRLKNASPSTATESVSMSEFVRSRVERAIEQAESSPPEQKTARLEELSKQLTAVSSEASVAEMTDKFQKWLGTGKRAETPLASPVPTTEATNAAAANGSAQKTAKSPPPPPGPFDFATAQIHDVRREPIENGFKYTSILIDAAGRTMEAPMSEAEGENLHRTMQLIKSNPLLEKIYRGVVMGMLDKMLQQP